MQNLKFKFDTSAEALAFISATSGVKNLAFVGVFPQYGRLQVDILAETKEMEIYAKAVSAGIHKHSAFVRHFEPPYTEDDNE